MKFNLARICHMYYEERMTQKEIAQQLGCSRIHISRMLQQARQEGIVSISIKYDGFFPELERKLSEKFPPVKFLIVNNFDGDGEALRQAIGIAGGSYVSSICQDVKGISVGWGSTMREFADNFPKGNIHCRVTPMTGGQNFLGLELHANHIAATLAKRINGKSENLLAPAVAGTLKERNAFVSSALVADVLQHAAESNIAVFSIGAPFAEHATIGKVGYFTQDDLSLLRKEDAACDVISTAFFDPLGNSVAESLTKRLVGITSAQLKSIPNKICLAGGIEKVQAIKIALEADFVDVLVTDDQVAKQLLK